MERAGVALQASSAASGAPPMLRAAALQPPQPFGARAPSRWCSPHDNTDGTRVGGGCRSLEILP